MVAAVIFVLCAASVFVFAGGMVLGAALSWADLSCLIYRYQTLIAGAGALVGAAVVVRARQRRRRY
jgi:hypothetical protein